MHTCKFEYKYIHVCTRTCVYICCLYAYTDSHTRHIGLSYQIQYLFVYMNIPCIKMHVDCTHMDILYT